MQHAMNYATAEALETELRRMWSPPPNMTVTEWADEYRYLSPESAARRGKYRSSFAPFQRGPMDAFTDPTVRRITTVCSVQVGKTTITENCIGRAIHLAPGPMLIVGPTHRKCEEFSKERLDPMFRDCPVLRERLAPKKSRDSGNTIFRKTFTGGLLALGSAGVAPDMASRPILYIFGEEVDQWEEDRTGQGNPLLQVDKRTTWYWNHKMVLSSSPTNLATSVIWPEFLKSDQRYFYIPCPHCGHFHQLEWDNLHWHDTDTGEPDYSTVSFACPECGATYGDAERPAMLRGGEWRATAPFTDHAGFHIWAAYSPMVPLARIVRDWWEAKENPRDLQVHWNTVRGLPWEGKGATVEWEDVYDNREHFDADIPDGVVALFAGVDTQNDRFEVTVYGAGLNGEGWLIDHRVIIGDPVESATREKLDDYLYESIWLDAVGVEFKILGTAVDTGGLRTQVMYKYCAARTRRNVIGIKGEGGESKPIIKRPSGRNVKGKTYKVWIVGTDGAKSEIYYRLAKDEEFGGLHIPRRAPFDEQYCRGLTAEECVVSDVNGRRKLKWRLRRGRKRNEPLDCLVYAMAAREAWGKDLGKYQKQLEAKRKQDDGEERKRPAQRARSKNWVKGWR